jgi:hydroxymethylpyrimidine/phosphomethylpyrimidine kinase
MKTVLTIAGSDPSGGAGIQADLKVFSFFGCYGISAISAQTVQNSQGVKEVLPTPGEFLLKEIKTLIEDFKVTAIKIGMLSTKKNVEKVVDCLSLIPTKNIVLDPVLLSSNGASLLDVDAIPILVKLLLPKVKLVTPNLYETKVFTGKEVTDIEGMKKSAEAIHSLGVENVLVKGGHLKDGATDVLCDGNTFTQIKGEKIRSDGIHGTGCVLSAAITVGLAEGLSVVEAVKRAKEFLNQLIGEAKKVGKGALFLL